MNIFSRYSPAIQRYIYEEGWQSLRAIQAAAGDAIFNTDANVLLSASTAAGKTEAAIFPIITLLQEQPPASIGCLYIAPLKALINDQFVRLNDICRECGVEVWHWHGDVSQEQKKNSCAILRASCRSHLRAWKPCSCTATLRYHRSSATCAL